MKYPVTGMRFTDGKKLYVPDPEQIKPVYESLLVNNPDEPFPFWAKIWPSAIVLAEFLQAEPEWITGKRVLEIGAGIGLPSFTMAPYAAEMVISDHSDDAVTLIIQNIQQLGLSHVSAVCLDWNHFPEEYPTDMVLLSDINYAPDQFASLQRLILNFLEQGSTLILSTPHRITLSQFAGFLEPYIKRSVLKAREEKNTVTDIQILILSL